MGLGLVEMLGGDRSAKALREIHKKGTESMLGGTQGPYCVSMTFPQLDSLSLASALSRVTVFSLELCLHKVWELL